MPGDIPKQVIDDAEAWLQADMFQAADNRRGIVQIATRIIEALSGKNPRVRSEVDDPSRELARAPKEIPALNWQGERIPERENPWDLSIVGNVGEYYSGVFHNEPPANTFNIGFYTGVLAVKQGLVDPDAFDVAEPAMSPIPKDKDV